MTTPPIILYKLLLFFVEKYRARFIVSYQREVCNFYAVNLSQLSKLATPISNGGLHFTPPGIITGSARGGISQYHYFWLPSYVGLATFFRPLVYHSLLVPECICVLSLHSHFPLLKRNILLPKNVYPHTYFDTLGACQTTSVYFYLLGMT